MKKENKKLKIVIKGNENNKSEIVYNNLLNNMESSDLSKDKQIEYLKSRINYLETNIKNKLILGIILVLNLVILALGIFFMYLDVYFLGILLSMLSFILVIILLLRFKNKNINYELNDDFAEIDTLRKLLNSKLK